MTIDPNSRIAVVAGGTAGVGRAVVEALLTRGYRVAVMARGQSRLDDMERQFGDRIWTRSVDVSDGAALTAAAQDIAAEFGTPEVWVNSAMLTSFSPFEKVEEEEFRRITETTYLGAVNGCRAALSVMEWGNIVNVGSGLAYASVPNQAAYCGAKHATEGFTQALRIELAQAGRPITLSMVQLPGMNTPQFDWALNRMDRKPQPAPPIFSPQVGADGVMRAIDTDAREILVGRSVLKLMVGNFLLPPTVERQLTKVGVSSQKGDAPPEGGPGNLDRPDPDYPARAAGSYGEQASNRAIIVDGDFARKGAALGGAALILVAGILLGRATRPREESDRPAMQDRDRIRRLPR
ncbi:SDR family oxidoreductase [Jannaschia rubra]|uniref:SDR family oxidoreductase n=1 Tax=Jannaschia rubra TaxID=282197 RepID=UPI00248F6AD4|nr:SDR family oxidoreductase [Jannaschia rubra]